MIGCKAIKKIGDRTILDVERTFEEGRIYAVIGNNGSGKSTLLNVLAGQIKFDGKVEGAKDVVYMPQTSYNFDFSVKRNVLLFAKTDEKRQRAEEMLQFVGLSALAKKNARTLSGGEGQKTALIRTLLQNGAVLLLDEPTSSMDEQSALCAEELIKEDRERTGRTIFIVTHSVAQAERLSDEILFLSDGKILEAGKDITKDPKTPELKTYLNNR